MVPAQLDLTRLFLVFHWANWVLRIWYFVLFGTPSVEVPSELIQYQKGDVKIVNLGFNLALLVVPQLDCLCGL